jgi:hypothetical protein
MLLFSGASPFPSTNNALERCNKSIKDNHSLRERVPFHSFTIWVERMVSVDWSRGRPIPQVAELKIEPHLYVSARQLHTSDRKIYNLDRDISFALPSFTFLDITRRDLKYSARAIQTSDFDSFDAYVDLRFKVRFFEFY